VSTTDHKTIELRTGRAHGRRLVVPINTTEVSVPIDGAKGFDVTEIYRPTATRSADGVEVWTPYVPPAWPETNVDPLA
jgi:hypothetical protein